MWICCQLGAREHYSVPRALHSRGELASFFTDAWVRGKAESGKQKAEKGRWLPKGLRERFHRDLADAPVYHSTLQLLVFEAAASGRRLQGWHRIMARNQ